MVVAQLAATGVLVVLLVVFAIQLFGGPIQQMRRRRREWTSRREHREFETRVEQERQRRDWSSTSHS